MEPRSVNWHCVQCQSTWWPPALAGGSACPALAAGAPGTALQKHHGPAKEVLTRSGENWLISPPGRPGSPISAAGIAQARPAPAGGAPASQTEGSCAAQRAQPPAQ